jgi:DNA primase
LSLTPQFLDELRTRISLSGVIGRSIRVTKAGREFKACCPFHNEKTPSFTINDEKGFYHCFGCGAHGDVIRWMTDQQGLPFMDAVKELALQAGMDVPAPDPREAARAEAQKWLHDVTAAAQDFFVRSLAEERGAEARRYLASRGFPESVVREFGFGFAPDSRTALKDALSAYPDAMLIEAGLRILVDDREPYDRFRGRLMLPILDPRGRVIAFGGRILSAEKKDAPKYLNSPDTPLFDKGRTVYNLHRAAPVARSKNRIVVVEGYMDVVALAAAGIAEAVAPLGTALTEDQIDRLWRVTECPTLCFDGDSAGQRAAMRAITRALPLLRPGHSLRIAVLPPGLDPDDVVKRDGARAMETLLEGARSMVEMLWEGEREAAPLTTPEDKAGLKARLMEHVGTIQHPDIKALYRRDLLERFDAMAFARRASPFEQRAPFQPGARKFQKDSNGAWKPAPPPLGASDTARMQKVGTGDGLLAAVLVGLIAHPGEIERHAEALTRVLPLSGRYAGLIDALLELSDSGHVLESEAIRTILDARQMDIPASADFAELPFGFITARDGSKDELADAVTLLVEIPAVEAALAEANLRYQAELSPETEAEKERLRERGVALRARLGQMGRIRGSL